MVNIYIYRLFVSLFFAATLAAQPAQIPAGDPVAANGSVFKMDDTVGNNVGGVNQSNSSFWDYTTSGGVSTVLFKKSLSNGPYTGSGWLEYGADGLPTSYIYIFYKNLQGDWRWDKRNVTIALDGGVSTVGSSVDWGHVSGAQ